MSVKYDFSGHRVLVTGAARGLGRAIILKFLSSGANCVALDKDEDKLKELEVQVKSQGQGHLLELVVADLLNWEESRAKVQCLPVFQHLVNNAGIPEVAYFSDIKKENIDRIFGVNFQAMVCMSQVMAEGMSKNGLKGGTIINISSILDRRALPGAVLYSCTKAAVSMLTKSMSVELAPLGIRVNGVRPTLMATELIPQETETHKKVATAVVTYCLDRQVEKRLLNVDEAADAVLYLSSDASEMVNGSNILVDGGACTA